MLTLKRQVRYFSQYNLRRMKASKLNESLIYRYQNTFLIETFSYTKNNLPTGGFEEK